MSSGFRGYSASMPPRFLAVGRFVSKKGPLDTLEAFSSCGV